MRLNQSIQFAVDLLFLITMIEKSKKELIKEYVDDHYKNFKFYPMDVEVDGKIYDYKSYMEILNND